MGLADSARQAADEMDRLTAAMARATGARLEITLRVTGDDRTLADQGRRQQLQEFERYLTEWAKKRGLL